MDDPYTSLQDPRNSRSLDKRLPNTRTEHHHQVPFISLLATVCAPVGMTASFLAKKVRAGGEAKPPPPLALTLHPLEALPSPPLAPRGGSAPPCPPRRASGRSSSYAREIFARTFARVFSVSASRILRPRRSSRSRERFPSAFHCGRETTPRTAAFDAARSVSRASRFFECFDITAGARGRSAASRERNWRGAEVGGETKPSWSERRASRAR